MVRGAPSVDNSKESSGVTRAWLKRTLLGEGSKPRKVLAGLLRGQVFPIDPKWGGQLLLGLHETELVSDFRAFAASSAGFVDIGSDLGWYVLATQKLNPAVKVRAFEPLPGSKSRFLQVLAANGLGPDGWLDWRQGAVGTSGTSLDAAVAGMPRPLLLKVDIEEFEVDALASGKAWLDQVDAIVWETHSDAFATELQALLTRAGWSVRRVRRAWWRRFLSDGRAADNAWLVAKRA